ncbi:MAG: LLM class flavin-dependent oxidoreductase [Candidatus Binatia bacterium]
MRFGLLQECETPPGTTHHRRYHEVMDEAVWAEDNGFDFWGTSEQHFLVHFSTVSAPETFYPAVAMRTKRLRLRHMVVLLPFPFNHPIRVAERAATLDIVSNGRVELGTGRANTLLQIDGFQVPIDETRARWEEGLEIVVKAFLHDPFSHEGRYFKIPPRSLTPKGVQQPHPPLFMVVQSTESHEVAGRKGLGAISWDMYMGREYWRDCIAAYRQGMRAGTPISELVTNSIGMTALHAAIAETTDEAVAIGGPSTLGFAGWVIEELYPALGKRSSTYAYTLSLEKLRSHAHDLDWLRKQTPSIILGDPDYWVARLKEYAEMGADEVIIRLDGQPHASIMKQIELLGKYVIPKFKTPRSVVGPMVGGGAP